MTTNEHNPYSRTHILVIYYQNYIVKDLKTMFSDSHKRNYMSKFLGLGLGVDKIDGSGSGFVSTKSPSTGYMKVFIFQKSALKIFVSLATQCEMIKREGGREM